MMTTALPYLPARKQMREESQAISKGEREARQSLRRSRAYLHFPLYIQLLINQYILRSSHSPDADIDLNQFSCKFQPSASRDPTKRWQATEFQGQRRTNQLSSRVASVLKLFFRRISENSSSGGKGRRVLMMEQASTSWLFLMQKLALSLISQVKILVCMKSFSIARTESKWLSQRAREYLRMTELASRGWPFKKLKASQQSGVILAPRMLLISRNLYFLLLLFRLRAFSMLKIPYQMQPAFTSIHPSSEYSLSEVGIMNLPMQLIAYYSLPCFHKALQQSSLPSSLKSLLRLTISLASQNQPSLQRMKASQRSFNLSQFSQEDEMQDLERSF